MAKYGFQQSKSGRGVGSKRASSQRVQLKNFEISEVVSENENIHKKILEKSQALSRKIKTQKKLSPFYNQIRVFSKKQYQRRSYKKILKNGWFPNSTLF